MEGAMKERTSTGKLRAPLRRGRGIGVAGRGSLAALPWALALLGASAVLAAAAVLAH
jgi:hypothetical protein